MKLLSTALFIFFILVSNLCAQTKIHVKGAGRLYPISMPELCKQSSGSLESKVSVELPKIVLRTLDFSGFFSVLNKKLYIEEPRKCGDNFAYSDWSIINSDALIKGEVINRGSQIVVRLFLHDVTRQKIVLAKEYLGGADQITTIGKRFANEVIGYFTGVKGVFGTKIAFSSKIGRFKELFIIDMDGSEQTQLTYDKALALSPSFSNDGSQIVFTSYRNRVPDLFLYDLSKKKIKQVTRSSSLEIGAKFTDNPNTLLLSLSHGRESDLVLISLEGKILKFLTRNNGILEVSPELSPNQKQIVFVANRSGGPQIYLMDVDGSNPKRVSYVNSNYCTSPAWSPDGKKLAYVCRAEGGFQIFTSDFNGENAYQLTNLGSNEDPSWSPDGRHIVFATTYWQGSRYSLGLMQSDGSNLKRLTNSRTGDTDPNFGPLM
jgi:TolB protein